MLWSCCQSIGMDMSGVIYCTMLRALAAAGATLLTQQQAAAWVRGSGACDMVVTAGAAFAQHQPAAGWPSKAAVDTAAARQGIPLYSEEQLYQARPVSLAQLIEAAVRPPKAWLAA